MKLHSKFQLTNISQMNKHGFEVSVHLPDSAEMKPYVHNRFVWNTLGAGAPDEVLTAGAVCSI